MTFKKDDVVRRKDTSDVWLVVGIGTEDHILVMDHNGKQFQVAERNLQKLRATKADWEKAILIWKMTE